MLTAYCLPCPHVAPRLLASGKVLKAKFASRKTEKDSRCARNHNLNTVRKGTAATHSDGYGRERDYVRPKASGKTKEGQKQSDFTISAELLMKYKYTNFISVQ